MLTLAGYRHQQPLYESSRTLVLRMLREEDGKSFVLKSFKEDRLSPRLLARLRHEHEMLSVIQSPGVISSLGILQGGRSLLLEDIGGITLHQHLKGAPLRLESFFEIAIKIVECLLDIHEQRVIHKDINPSNIVINPQTGQVQIIDFGLSTNLPSESQEVEAKEVLEGTYSYISPEQTGRMNRLVDFRSDFYSLGVTFFEMLTGSLPFHAKDPMEMVHCHIAKPPPNCHRLRPSIPPMVADLVGKLLAKNAEERYNSCQGILADLAHCQQEYHSTGQIQSFLLARQDKAGVFQISQKLYGRTDEIQYLRDCLERVSWHKPEMILVSGSSGMGKTVLIKELKKEALAQQSFYLSGKFDQFKRNIPYASLIESFRILIRQLLSQPEEELQQWKARLSQSLGTSGQVIVDVIWELGLILGPQPELPQLGPKETQNRFNRVFQRFVQTFANENQPLILVLDDLQWADTATLSLIGQLMLNPETRYILFIGAFRDAEIPEGHAFRRLMEQLEEQNSKVSQIYLLPLAQKHITELIQESLNQKGPEVEELARLIEQKTEGNPFFVVELFRSLHQQRLIQYHHPQHRWVWDLARIKLEAFTENVLSLMANKLDSLPSQTGRMLSLAACIGNQFDLATLSTLAELPGAELVGILRPAVSLGMLFPQDSTYQLVEQALDAQTGLSREAFFRFFHDRVQQAAHLRLEEAERQKIHLTIGRMRMHDLGDQLHAELLFDVVDHFRQGLSLLHDQEEKSKLARLCFHAGTKAKDASAYDSALSYLVSAKQLLGPEIWAKDYALALPLYLESAESRNLVGDIDGAEAEFNQILGLAQTARDKSRVHRHKVILLTNRGMYKEAISEGQKALAQFGIDLPDDPKELSAAIGAALGRIKQLQGDRPVDSLLDLPSMTDPDQLEVMHCLVLLNPSTFFANPTQLALVALKGVVMSLEHGNCEFSATGYATFGVVLGAQLGDYLRAYQFSALGLKLNERYDNKALNAKLAVSAGAFVNHWGAHLSSSIAIEEQGFQDAIETGDLVFATYCLGGAIRQMHALGAPLHKYQQEARTYLDFIERTKSKDQTYYYIIADHYCRLLKTQGKNMACWDTKEGFREEQLLFDLERSPNKAAIHWYLVLKMQLAIYELDWEAAETFGQRADSLRAATAGQIQLTEHCFYYGLVLINKVRTNRAGEKDKELLAGIFKLFETWATSCPENFRHKLLFLQAEDAGQKGDVAQAMDLFDLAIKDARDQGFHHQVAFACERAGRFFLAIHKNWVASSYLNMARQGYLNWGALQLVKHLDRQFPGLKRDLVLSDRIDASQDLSRTQSTATDAQALDLQSVLKAARVLSGEIVLKNLLVRLMNVVGENAGAQTSSLILKRDGQWLIEAQSDAQSTEVEVLRSIPLEQGDQRHSSLKVCPAVVQYVARTRESLILEDALSDPRFSHDPYLKRHKPQSILCLPLEHKDDLVGILYLENNLVRGAFTQSRLQMIKLLAAQIAVSLENARIYLQLEELNKNLEQKVTERTHKLNQAMEELKEQHQKLKDTQAQLVQSEKMAGLGTLVAGVAHEINNPVNFVFGNVQKVEEELNSFHQFLTELAGGPEADQDVLAAFEQKFGGLFASLKDMHDGTYRIKTIVEDLRTFSRLEEADQKKADVIAGLESSLRLIRSKYVDKVDFETKFEPLPPIECWPAQLNQVFVNLLVNGCQAILTRMETNPEPRGLIRLSTYRLGEKVGIEIADNGIGMDSHVMGQIFDPFFTTKQVGQGTGLGLSISYGIIKRHKGEILVDSRPQAGTTFTLLLPQHLE